MSVSSAIVIGLAAVAAMADSCLLSAGSSVISVWVTQNDALVQDVTWQWDQNADCSQGLSYPPNCQGCLSMIFWRWDPTSSTWVQGSTWSANGVWRPSCGTQGNKFTAGPYDLLYWPAGNYDLECIFKGNSACGTMIEDLNHYFTISNP